MKTIYKIISCACVCLLLLPVKVYLQGIYNKTGASFVTNGNVQIVVQNGGFKNDGNFIKSGSFFIFSGNGSTAGSFISGTTNTSFHNLTLNKTSNGLQLNSDISVAGTVTFLSGDSIYLNNHVIDLGTTGSITGENNNSRFTGLNGGYIMLNRSLLAPAGVNPGNIGVAITSLSNLGNTVIKRYQTIQKGKSVSRAYEIVPANNSTLLATLEFSYFHNEMNSITEALLATYSSTNNGTTWVQVPNTSLNTTTNTLNSILLNSFHFYTLFRNGVDLPVKLLYFKGALVNQNSLLTWATSSETDNDHFEIERSANGLLFSSVGVVAGSGNSSIVQTYSFTDRQLLTGANYYRLKQVDRNGKYDYSETIKIQNAFEQELLTVSPNPASINLNIKLISESTGEAELIISNQAGITCKTKQVHLSKGVNLISLPVYDLNKGLYTLQIRGTVNQSFRFMKN